MPEMPEELSDDLDAALDASGRRSFLKKAALGAAFVPPAVSSFTMSGISAVYAQTPSVSGQVDSDEVEATTTTEAEATTTSTTTAPNQTTTTLGTNQTETTTTTLVGNQPPP